MADPGSPRPGAHPDHAHRPSARERWADFRTSPYRPALVLCPLTAAGLFAGSYTYQMAKPTPGHVPIAVVGEHRWPQGLRFVDGMERAPNAGLSLHPYRDYGDARDAIEEQKVFAVLSRDGGRARLDPSGASGASVAQLLA
ncbi:integral membrane protein [Streptomyces sp. SPB074]|nr:integral membrane protein [Streptomyces sp. SPB074]